MRGLFSPDGRRYSALRAGIFALLAALSVLALSKGAWAQVSGAAPTLTAASPKTGLLRVVVGLAGAFVLAVLATHPFFRRLERRLGLTVILSSGLPFLALGVVFRLPSVGILTNEVVSDLRPLLEFGVGWLGFVVGLQFDVRDLDMLPDKTSSVVVAESAIPFFVVAVIAALLLLGLEPTQAIWQAHTVPDFFRTLSKISLRDALALGACAAPAAPVAAVAIARESGGRAAWLVQRITSMNDVAGVFVMALICAFYRPSDDYSTWHLPHVAWLFLTLGFGGLFGILTYLLVRGAQTEAQEMALLLGSTAISAGMSGYLGISPLVTCAIAGALLTNLPYRGMERLRKTMLDVERPLYLIFLLVAGALWDPSAWQGWLLVPFFVLARVSGKVLGAYVGKRLGPEGLPDAATLGLALAPQSPISIATCVAYLTLYNPLNAAGTLSWLMTACVGGAVLTELVVQVVVRIRGGLVLDPKDGPQNSMPSAIPPPLAREAAAPSSEGGS
jgi:Kef-type K+ transport system membrane component KefB